MDFSNHLKGSLDKLYDEMPELRHDLMGQDTRDYSGDDANETDD